MPEEKDKTYFAPATRSGSQQLFHDAELLKANLDGSPFLDVSPSLLMVLNAERQIINANESVLSFLGVKGGQAEVLGKRPGEALNCENAKSAPSGCGTAEACRSCGAVLSILACLDYGQKCIGECQISRDTPDGVECLNLRVSSSPLLLEGKRYVVFSAADINDELRRNYLEGIFIHEVRNSAGNILTLSGLLKDECAAGPSKETALMLSQAAECLMAEIDGHRILIDAETRRLKVEQVSFSSVQLLERLASEYARGIHGEGRRIEISKDSVELAIHSDPGLLSQVLSKILQNALEASAKGDFVRISCQLSENGSGAVFEIWNRAFIKRSEQLQIFHRHFSTKNSSKGIGTYMARLLTERYLNGKISFTSSSGAGTVFRIEIPLESHAKKLESLEK